MFYPVFWWGSFCPSFVSSVFCYFVGLFGYLSCVHNVSELSVRHCPFGFLYRLFTLFITKAQSMQEI